MCYRGVVYDRQPTTLNLNSELADIKVSQVKFRGQTYQQQTISFASLSKQARFLGQTQHPNLACQTTSSVTV